MGIKSTGNLLHWNYFLALESDLDNVSRYIEFDRKNYKTFSIELVHLFLAASSEVDVVTKKLCGLISPDKTANTITDYKEIIRKSLPSFAKEEIFIPRYGLNTKPWSEFIKDKTPVWWKSHNKVKHNRDEHFSEANLHNVINSIGGLLIANFYFYQFELDLGSLRDVGHKIKPEAKLVHLNPEYYPTHLILN